MAAAVPAGRRGVKRLPESDSFCLILDYQVAVLRLEATVWIFGTPIGCS
jgi:hypothetical protein